MHGYMFADSSGFFDRRPQLSFCVLIGRRKRSVAQFVAAGFVHLDEIGPFLELLADDLNDFFRSVRIRSVRQNVLCRVVLDRIFMSAEDVDRISTDAQPRSGDEASINRVAYGGVGRTGAFGAHIALGSETRQEVIS